VLKISADCDCGVLALFDIAYHAAGRRTQTREIAERQRLSKGHIEQVFQRLRRGKLVKSQRGPAGGFSLAKPVEEITIGDIVRAIDGPIQLVLCVGDEARSRAYCERIHSCAARDVWKGASDLLMSFFDSVTVADLCQRARDRGIRRVVGQGLTYQI